MNDHDMRVLVSVSGYVSGIVDCSRYAASLDFDIPRKVSPTELAMAIKNYMELHPHDRAVDSVVLAAFKAAYPKPKP